MLNESVLSPENRLSSTNTLPFNPQLRFVEREKLLPLFQNVEKPGRYVGGEFGIPTHKNPSTARVKVLFTYPDTYELGMSNQGLKILYDMVQRVPEFLADRAFLPWPDFGKALQEHQIPLYSLDQFLTVQAFDVWAFNTATELSLTNLLYSLDLAQIPLLRAQRRPSDPFIITGGTAVSNPLPFFDFMDAIFMGDGEEAIVDIARIIDAGKIAGKSRAQILHDLREVEGLFVPELYTVQEQPSLEALVQYQGPTIKKRNYRGKDFAVLENVIVPNIEITQDRVVLEVARGCAQGCRFCHAGFWKRPVRNTEVATLVHNAEVMLKRTGSDSISLHSLSIADYPWLEELVVELAQKYGPQGISLSLPSLRVQVKTIPVLAMTSDIRRSSVTFALEAGSELMRERIFKKSSEENLHYLIQQVFDRGWDLVKVYFMMGLPDRDGREVEDLTRALNSLGALAQKNGPRKNINATVSLFVPKPHTTFQWEQQRSPQYFQEGISKIKAGLKSNRVHLKYPDPWMAYIEGLLSRSDSRIGKYVLSAYQQGAKFDNWDDQFNMRVWQNVLEQIPVELKNLWLEQKPGGSPTPWDGLVAAIPTAFLKRDFEKFENVTEENMNPARKQMLDPGDFPPELLKPVHIPENKFNTDGYLVIEYQKQWPFIYISHLDSAEVIRKACRRSEIPMTFSQGFNKREKFHFTSSLPLFIYSESETIIVELYEQVNLEEAQQKLAANFPNGLIFKSVRWISRLPKINSELRDHHYRLDFVDQENWQAAKQKFEQLPEAISFSKIERKAKKLKGVPRGQVIHKTVTKKVKPAIEHFRISDKKIEFELKSSVEGTISIADFLTYYLELPVEKWNTQVKVSRCSESFLHSLR